MSINLYDFHDIIRETYNEYVSRYEIDLVDFKSEFGADSEPKFIDYQRIYLGKMRDYIIENLSKIDNEDLDSQFYHDKLQEALSENKKMFHFLNIRLNPMNYIPEQKENTSKDEVSDFLEKLNNGKVNKSFMIDFLESRNTLEKLKALIEDIESYKVNHIVHAIVYNETNKNRFSEESFESFNELVLSKIEELKNKDAYSDENKKKPKKELTQEPWFIAGLSDATGELEKLISRLGSQRKAAIHLGLNSHNYVVTLTYKNSMPKTRDIHFYCIENDITTTDEFKKIVSEHKKLNKNIDWENEW